MYTYTMYNIYYTSDWFCFSEKNSLGIRSDILNQTLRWPGSFHNCTFRSPELPYEKPQGEEEDLMAHGERARPWHDGVPVEPPDDSGLRWHLMETTWDAPRETSRRPASLSPVNTESWETMKQLSLDSKENDKKPARSTIIITGATFTFLLFTACISDFPFRITFLLLSSIFFRIFFLACIC